MLTPTCFSTFVFLYSSWHNQLVGEWQAHGGVYSKFIFPLSLSSLLLKLESRICPFWRTAWLQKWLLFHSVVVLFSHQPSLGRPWGLRLPALQPCLPAESPGRSRAKSASNGQLGLRHCPWKDNSSACSRQHSGTLSSTAEIQFLFCSRAFGKPSGIALGWSGY